MKKSLSILITTTILISTILSQSSIAFAEPKVIFDTGTQEVMVDEENLSVTDHNEKFPAEEAQGIDYIRNKYGIDIHEMNDLDFAQYMRDAKFRDMDAFTDIINNLSDEDYEEYYILDQYCEENDLYRRVKELIPFVIQNEVVLCGTDIVLEMNGLNPIIPDHMIFQVIYTDGSESYIYANDSRIHYELLDNVEGFVAVYTDEDGKTSEFNFTLNTAFRQVAGQEMKESEAEEKGIEQETEIDWSNAKEKILENAPAYLQRLY